MNNKTKQKRIKDHLARKGTSIVLMMVHSFIKLKLTM